MFQIKEKDKIIAKELNKMGISKCLIENLVITKILTGLVKSGGPQ